MFRSHYPKPAHTGDLISTLMPNDYLLTSTSAQSFQVDRITEDGVVEHNIELDSTNITRKVVRALIVRNRTNPEEALRITIAHQRKTPTGDWQDVQAINLNTLRGDEGVRFDLNSHATKRLFEELQNFYGIAYSGQVRAGQHDLVVGRIDELIRADSGRAAVFQRMLGDNCPEEFWEFLSTDRPNLATKLAFARVQSRRLEALDEFRESLERERDESYWQEFFSANRWIFGYGLKYCFLSLITDQPHYIGADYDGVGTQRGDYLMNSEAEKKFTVLVEIKKPQTALFHSEQYRAGVWKLGSELLWAATQVQINCSSWSEDGARRDRARDDLESQRSIFTYQPKGILVIGHTGQMGNNRAKVQTFQSYRQNLHNPEIVTFDELFERARFIVAHCQQDELAMQEQPGDTLPSSDVI